MSIKCNLEIISAFKEVKFPKTKAELLSIAEAKNDLCEASIIALNQLDDKTFNSLDEVCSNVKIACTLEIYDVLKGFKFPADRDAILKYMDTKDCSKLAIQKINELHPGIEFYGISDICK